MVGRAGVVIACALLNIAGVKVVSLTSLWLLVALSAPFAVIVVMAPFKLGALADAVTKPTTSTVDILGGFAHLHVELHGMGQCLDHCRGSGASAADLSRAMLVAVCIVAATYILPFAAIWMTGLKATAWETGSWADIAALIGDPCCASAWCSEHDERLWHVQRPGHELFAPAVGDGAGWHASWNLRHAAEKIAGALGWIIALAIGWGMCLGLGFARLVTLDILLYGASLLLEFMALAVLALP